VIVTGSSRGIGKGCAQEFVRAGARVVLCGNDEAAGTAVASELQAQTRANGCGDAIFLYCDVRNTGEIQNLIDVTISRFGRLDCLINNAGWHPPHKPIDDFSVEDFRDLIDLNLVSVFAACKYALPHLRKARGNIINIASLVATIGQRHAATYVATKGAVAALTRALAIDEAPNGVRVNSVSPGNVDTPMWQEAADASADPGRFRAEGEAAQPLGRFGTIEEAGRLCLFIASQATFTTGVDHILSGGAELGYGRKCVPKPLVGDTCF